MVFKCSQLQTLMYLIPSLLGSWNNSFLIITSLYLDNYCQPMSLHMYGGSTLELASY